MGGPNGGAPRGPIAGGLHGGGAPHFAMGGPHGGGGPHGTPLRLGTRSRHGRRAPRGAPLHGGRQRQIRGSVPSHGARVPEVRIHLPPAGSQERTPHRRCTICGVGFTDVIPKAARSRWLAVIFTEFAARPQLCRRCRGPHCSSGRRLTRDCHGGLCERDRGGEDRIRSDHRDYRPNARATWRYLDPRRGRQRAISEDRWRHGEAKRIRGLEIDDQLERSRLLDRQIGRIGALADLGRLGQVAQSK